MREPGFYWVKYVDVFEVAFWDGEAWELIMGDNFHDDTDFAEIDERRIDRKDFEFIVKIEKIINDIYFQFKH